MKRRRSADQRIMDRAREARMNRIAGKGLKENYDIPREEIIRDEKGGRREMIKVTRLNGEILYLNVFQIESMETIPETKIRMMNGDYFLVKDSEDSVLEQIKAFINSCVIYGHQK